MSINVGRYGPWIWLMVLVGWCAGAASEERPLVLGYVEFPPYTFTSDTGQADGIYLERAGQVLAAAGLPWVARSVPAARLYPELARGDVDLFLGIDSSPLIRDQVLSSQQLLGTIVLKAYTLDPAPPISDNRGLLGRRVGLLHGYAYGSTGDFLRAAGESVAIHDLRTHLAGFRMLAAGRIDVLLDYAGPGEATIQHLGLEGIQGTTLFELPCYFVLSKAAPAAETVMARIDAAHEQMVSEVDGER